MKSPIKWAGGKAWLAPELEKLWKASGGSRWVEPFCGGASAAFAVSPSKAVLNDKCPPLVGFLWHLQNGGEAAGDLQERSKEQYYRARGEFNALLAKGLWYTERAAQLFFYLNRTCFNGLCRFNRRGFFNVPYGGERKESLSYDAKAYAQIMQGWEIFCGSYEDVPVEEGDFVYADPPYWGTFTQYTGEQFGWEDQERLARWLDALPAAVVVASNSWEESIVALYEDMGWEIRKVSARRSISAQASGRGDVFELLAIRRDK